MYRRAFLGILGAVTALAAAGRESARRIGKTTTAGVGRFPGRLLHPKHPPGRAPWAG